MVVFRPHRRDLTAQGALLPDSEVRRFHAPVDGELAKLYVAEGQPVSKGDVLARLDARGAVEAAANALQAQLKLEDAERDWKQFPEKKALMERKLASLKQALELAEHQHARRVSEGTAKFAEAQRAQPRRPAPGWKTPVAPATRPRTRRKSTRGCSRCPVAAGCRSYGPKPSGTPCCPPRTPMRLRSRD